MSRIMGHNQSLGQNDIVKFNYCSMIRFLIKPFFHVRVAALIMLLF
jgi:hypothetical protein